MALPPPALTSAMILREEECSPVQKETGSPYIQHRCQIPVPDPRNYSQYIVSVRPKVEERLIKSSDNSEFAPSLLCGASPNSTASDQGNHSRATERAQAQGRGAAGFAVSPPCACGDEQGAQSCGGRGARGTSPPATCLPSACLAEEQGLRRWVAESTSRSGPAFRQAPSSLVRI